MSDSIQEPTDELMLKQAINNMLTKCFGEDDRIYGHEVTQGYIEPCFFTDLRLASDEQSSATTTLKVYNVYIYFFQNLDEYDESIDYKVMKKLRLWLIDNSPAKNCYILPVGHRRLTVHSLSNTRIGENYDRFEISFTLRFNDGSLIPIDYEDVGDHESKTDIKESVNVMLSF